MEVQYVVTSVDRVIENALVATCVEHFYSHRSLARMAVRADDYDSDLEGEDGERRVCCLLSFLIFLFEVLNGICKIYMSGFFMRTSLSWHACGYVCSMP